MFVCKNKSMESLQRFRITRRRLSIFVLCFCLLFLIYQLMSLKILNIQMSEQLTHFRDNDFVSKHTLNDNQRQQELSQIESNSNVDTKSDNNLNNNKSVEQIMIKTQKVFRILGVLPKYAELYHKTGDSFRCLISGEEIPYQYINDDYCDCNDGTDEPSTNACPHNKFYCRTDSGKSDDYISSSKVNDGICDCCDGSDEFKGISTPLKLTKSQIATIKSSKKLVRTPPCPYLCKIF